MEFLGNSSKLTIQRAYGDCSECDFSMLYDYVDTFIFCSPVDYWFSEPVYFDIPRAYVDLVKIRVATYSILPEYYNATVEYHNGRNVTVELCLKDGEGTCALCGEGETSAVYPGQILPVIWIRPDFEASQMKLTPGSEGHMPCGIEPYGIGNSS